MANTARDLEALAQEMRGRETLRGSLLLLLILLFIIVAVTWAALTELDDVTRADGRIVPTQHVQVIQAAEQGVLQALHVAEGDLVQAGESLMELDRTLLTSQLDQEQQRAFGLMARIARLQAEIDGHDLEFMPELVQRTPSVVRSEAALFAARREELSDRIEVLERQRMQRRQEYEEGLVDQETARTTLALIDEEIAIIAPLVERRVEPETTILGLRRNEAEWRGREIRARATLVRLRSSLDEIDDRIRSVRSEVRAAALSELSIATAELAELEPRLPALIQRVTRSELRAPVRGIVNRILLTTQGGVAQAGETLLEIVPLDDTLLVEAYVRPSDIAFLYPGQPVKVKITAYDFSRYGGIDGEITRIGADAVTRPDRDEQVFIVHVRTQTNILDADGAALEIIPGMVAEVDILAGQKTVLEYLTQPVIRVKDRALRE
ncbi:HlyD family type I secretion periplasmic adaptor subunit [Roseinatronobacter sp. S2]|uniref:HlyD family type I secretion periplasmic adaptor subunit n=1 Tax=Roseinatronobacter sp. S2 TaxID=3035471 RepID=UPI00240F1335|nr:HlyD family type I secretion periplasmic adaptor subunit [Roseinatronobacter sp. S2]WFE75628.1 HlyD family type I secretion periplasmic adaptor subunit [Roseinatronobacter sp. S2]